MEVYLSEEEQWQKIKEWWKKYGNTILMWLVLFCGISFGWRYWQNYRTHRTERASMLYSQLISADMMHKAKDVNLFAKHLISDYGSTPYASLASLLLARDAVAAGNLKTGLLHLQWVIANSDSDGFRQIARIRAARVLLAQKKPRRALQLLSQTDDVAYTVVTKEVMGDVYLSMGRNKAARSAYLEAQKAAGKDLVAIKFLQMKIAQLPR